jgi:hypothetical protein
MAAHTPPPLIVLELNEVTIPYIEAYIRDVPASLPTFAKLLREHACQRTRSESQYENIEPWIQWVSAHTGKTFAEHNVFRLGDIEPETSLRQIYETLEARGVSVGAVSPMNAANRCVAPAFFVPDPWTPTKVTAPALATRVYKAICRAVGENASGAITLQDLVALGLGLLRYGRPRHALTYAKLALFGAKKRWHRAAFLDLFISDLFVSLWQSTRPQFSTLFVNGAAHVQHHYMYNAQPYSGEIQNPGWYVSAGEDPLLEIYKSYDKILSSVLSLGARVIVATGLSQVPYPKPIYYYRLRDHEAFLKAASIPFQSVSARMSRDFIVTCAGDAEVNAACTQLAAYQDQNGVALFDVDDRRDGTMFVTLTYANEITSEAQFSSQQQTRFSMGEHVIFVALKNGHHTDVGYVIDTARPAAATNASREDVPITSLYTRCLDAFA